MSENREVPGTKNQESGWNQESGFLKKESYPISESVQALEKKAKEYDKVKKSLYVSFSPPRIQEELNLTMDMDLLDMVDRVCKYLSRKDHEATEKQVRQVLLNAVKLVEKGCEVSFKDFRGSMKREGVEL